MNSAYDFNLYIKDTFSGSLVWFLYTGLTVFFLIIEIVRMIMYIFRHQ